jgi:hypothetical protein
MHRFSIVTIIVGLVSVAAVGGCQQGVGQRCEITSDCEDGLTCNASTHKCQSGTSSNDAGVGSPDAPLDAEAVDAVSVDATPPVDAGVDATPDA